MTGQQFLIVILLVAAAIVLLFGSNVPWGSLIVSRPAAPIKTDKLVVYAFEDASTEGRRKLTTEQDDILRASLGGDSLKKYVESLGGAMEIFDIHQDVSLMPPAVQEAAKLPRTAVPWVVLANAKTGYSQPLTNTADVKKLLDIMEKK